MQDALEVIKMIIAAHRTIREHIKLAGDTVNDIEALFTLRRTDAEWAQSSINTLDMKLDRLRQTISLLDQGLKNHFNFEREVLPPLLGELLMLAILLEHRDIVEQLDAAKAMLASTKLEGLSQQELLLTKSKIQSTIGSISQMVEDHARREELILTMIERAAEEKKSEAGKAAGKRRAHRK